MRAMTSELPLPPPAAEKPAAAANVAEYTVSEISLALRRTLEDSFGYVRVRGEISGFRGVHGSGHCYFALKDDSARLEAVIWRSNVRRVRSKLQEGLEVVATGRISTFPGASKYQLIVETIEPAGIGALMALIEERKQRLAAEGLFDPARKKPIPFLPKVIGVVTSPTGAVIRDILHRLADRFPRHVVVWPVRVQGDTCGDEVAAAIGGFNGLVAGGSIARPDLIIVARGGGSIEDLWGFNDEAVVRAAAASAIPLIAAVGHETDWTLIDLAADERAPTPTAAAERAVPVRADLLVQVGELGLRQARATGRLMEERRARLKGAARGLPRLEDILALLRQRFDGAAGRLLQALKAGSRSHRQAYERLAWRLSPRPLVQNIARERQALSRHAAQARRCLDRTIAHQRQALDGCAKLLASLSYRSVLGRGFALVRTMADKPIRSAAAAHAGEAVSIEFHDGRVGAVIGNGAASRRKQRGDPDGGAGQGSLF